MSFQVCDANGYTFSSNYGQATADTILAAFNDTTYLNGALDVQHTPLYDTLTYAAGATISQGSSAQFFATTSGKTIADTNMTQSKRLAAPETFAVLGMRFYFGSNILQADVVSVLASLALVFYRGKKSYQVGPLWNYNAGGGLYGYVNNTTASTVSGFFGNGVPDRNAMHRLAIPLVLDAQTDFWAELAGTNVTLAGGGTGARLQLLLDGLYARGMQ